MTIAFTRTGRPPQCRAHAAATRSSSDDMLIARIAGGDQLAMRTLFARYQMPVFRWLLRIVRDESLAEDLLSDVFLDVWRQAARFEGRSSVSTWLLAIARYKALSAWRRRTDAALDDEVAATIADPTDNPEIVLQKKDRGELLRNPWPGSRRSTARSSTSSTTTASRSRRSPRSSVIAEATVKTRMFYARKKLAELVEAA